MQRQEVEGLDANANSLTLRPLAIVLSILPDFLYLGASMCLVGSEHITDLKITLSFLASVLKRRGYAHLFFKAVNSASLDARAGTAICLQGTRSQLCRARYTPLIETRLTVLF